ncbi:CubicO group peptidase (beta-lactamase class C family) [Sphingopyxis panaciterrae]|uniref:serine hydrolase domain-containing protein n=1 Tax=Sphingopyxis panaciterrae TaxID=363841 RepID=UPI00141EB56D|nr:serine hydrolase domain-containing protein [Sphingopyxis panaciterrae]NIJ38798.1 CubicO group peptidase (beta-lactamase class C family) [Sphingopyxis panaciterrae]
MGDDKFRIEFDEKAIDAIFANVDQGHGAGCAAGIAIGGTPVYRKGFGLANMELPIVLSPATRMSIGSITKHFTCLAFMLLVEEGRASLDDMAGKHLPDLHPLTHRVTMLQLMGHLGGLRDAYDIISLFSGVGNQVTAAETLSIYRDIDDVNADPGTSFSYNNGAYVILAAIIEKVSGQDFRDVLRQRIFEPVGLHDTLLRSFELEFLVGAATLHAMGPNGVFQKGHRFLEGGGQGGIYSTVDDMLRWLRHMDAPTVGSPETWRLMTTPMTLSNGTSTGYGMGLIASDYRGVGTIHHSGGVVGGNAQMTKVPGAGLDIVVMVNRDDVIAPRLVHQIMDACLPGLDARRAVASGAIRQGVFRSNRSGRVAELFERGGEQIVAVDGIDMIYAAADETHLYPAAVGVPDRQSIVLIGDGKTPSALKLNEFGRSDLLEKVQPATASDPQEIAGRYRCEKTGADVFLSSNAEMWSEGRFGTAHYKLAPIAENIWRGRLEGTTPVDAILAFADGSKTLEFSGGGMRPMTFQRV